MAMRLLLACAFVLGCGGLPEPRIIAIEPAEVIATSITPIVITLDAVLPTQVSYSMRDASSEASVSVFVGTTEVGSSRVDPSGKVRALAPAGLERGRHDVVVQFRDRRRAVSVGGLTVR